MGDEARVQMAGEHRDALRAGVVAEGLAAHTD
jgi:hypothetical protein